MEVRGLYVDMVRRDSQTQRLNRRRSGVPFSIGAQAAPSLSYGVLLLAHNVVRASSSGGRRLQELGMGDEILTGRDVSHVVRVGDTVRRPTG